MIGLNKAYDFYRTVYGRNHIDGSDGYYVATAAHQENLGEPARAWWYRNIWGQESYWIDFRSRLDPNAPGGPTELSVTAHEWTHLVNYRSARVGREGSDSFGAHAVNEAMSTILGTACRLWDSTGGGGGIGYPDPSHWKFDWSYEPQVYGSQPEDPNINAVEFLYRPSKLSVPEPSWWNIGDYGVYGDPHRAGAPLHRAFYFLANGAQPIRNRYDNSDEERGRTTPFLPWGFNGLGAHNAALVFYQALTQTMHQGTDLQQSAYDLIAAGNQLFGVGSPSAKAVRKALSAVNLITPETYYLPWTTSPNTPSLATLIPNEETFFQLSGALYDGDGAYHLRVTLPPYGTILFSTTSGFPSETQWQESLGVEIQSSDGSTLLASAEPQLDVPYDPIPIETPTVDPLPQPPPQPTITATTATANIRYTNTGGTSLPILIKLRSTQTRTGGSTYVSYGIVQFREPIEQPGGATSW